MEAKTNKDQSNSDVSLQRFIDALRDMQLLWREYGQYEQFSSTKYMNLDDLCSRKEIKEEKYQEFNSKADCVLAMIATHPKNCNAIMSKIINFDCFRLDRTLLFDIDIQRLCTYSPDGPLSIDELVECNWSNGGDYSDYYRHKPPDLWFSCAREYFETVPKYYPEFDPNPILNFIDDKLPKELEKEKREKELEKKSFLKELMNFFGGKNGS